jgi:hypothetical protein
LSQKTLDKEKIKMTALVELAQIENIIGNPEEETERVGMVHSYETIIVIFPLFRFFLNLQWYW